MEIPSALYAGFYWTLKQLQNQFKSEERLAFLSSIASSEAGASPEVSPPVYKNIDGICGPARRVAHQRCPNWDGLIDIEADGLIGVSSCKENFVDNLCRQTTLDRGQATALSENLCSGFAFTQGPPGTGKTYGRSKSLDTLTYSDN